MMKPTRQALILAGIMSCVLPTAFADWKCGLYPDTDTIAAEDTMSTAHDRRRLQTPGKWDRAHDYASDRAEITKLANTMGFKHWPSKRNWLDDSVSFCEWECICCEKNAEGMNRLTEIHIERNMLSGAFSDTMVRMDKLKVINFHGNNVTNVPPGIEALTDLREFKFGRNPVGGDAGTVLAPFANLTKLVKFNCNFCAITGQFPDIFANKAATLAETFWDGNGLTGTLPPSLGALKVLTKISFNLNSLTGPVPKSLCAATTKATDCRIGSDTAYPPYAPFTPYGHDKYPWSLPIKGNLFSCPVPSCILDGVCNSKHASPAASPVKCK